jgi:hypothetical protein
VSLQVKSSEREKSRMYLKRTKVAMQALLTLSAIDFNHKPITEVDLCKQTLLRSQVENQGKRRTKLTKTPTPSSPKQQPWCADQSPTASG